MKSPAAIFLSLFLLAFAACCQAQVDEEAISVTRKTHSLGIPGAPEWAEFADSHPLGPSWSSTFTAAPNPHEYTLFIQQDDVKKNWSVRLNGKNLGDLFHMEAPLVHTLTVPPGTLRQGENQLEIGRSADEPDNIRLGPIRLIKKHRAAAIHQSRLEITVLDAEETTLLPGRITLLNESGALSPLIALEPNENLAVRPGVIYTPNGRATVGLPAGYYMLHATRGFEYGLDSQEVRLEAGDAQSMELRIAREVETEGWISCDTHIHTLTYSGHGDATIDERVVTLAGEGIELPVATDHNYLTDLEEASRRMGVRQWFTPVVGDEVTTKQAHFNVFPIEPGAPVPAHQYRNWLRLFENFRSTPGVQVIVLNHPENIHNNFRPFSPEQFNPVTGAARDVMEYGFNAIELVNSSAQQSDFMSLYEGWFAMLNRGQRIVGVGSSDGHDVSRYIVGQGRTYIAGNDSDVSNLSVASTFANLLAGRASVSMGLLTEIQVKDRYGMGDLVPAGEEGIKVQIQVRGPSWTTATNLVLFANGQPMRELNLSSKNRVKRQGDVQIDVEWRVEDLPHDVYLVALATGPGVSEDYWEIPRPYQRRMLEWTPRVIASTNPVWVDGDGDGHYTSPRGYAQKLWDRHGSNVGELLNALEGYDRATIEQAAEICAENGLELRKNSFQTRIKTSSGKVKEGFDNYLQAADLGAR